MFAFTIRSFLAIAALTLALTPVARADDGLRLADVAAEYGYTYQWDPTEIAATLIRPGLHVVIRAGQAAYEVNDAYPETDGVPQYDGHDLIISARLAERLQALSRKYRYPTSMMQAPFAPDDAAKPAAANGKAQLSLHMRKTPGQEIVELSGFGPAHSPIVITLTGEPSDELPVLVLSRHTVVTAADGSFSLAVLYQQDAHAGTAITAYATMPSGSTFAKARLVTGLPSPEIEGSALDVWPKK